MSRRERGAIQMVDAFLTFFVLVAMLALAPVFTHFASMLASEADTFSTLILSLFMPMMFIALIYSVGVSAKRGG
jgi:hypothetical protein